MRQDLRSVVTRGNGRLRLTRNRPVVIRDDDGVAVARVRDSRKEAREGFHPNVRFGAYRRFLESRVGEPWDAVRSDLVRAFGADDLAFLVDWDVDEHTLVDPDGCVVDSRGRRADYLHVDPRDGRLARGDGWNWAPGYRRRNRHRSLLDPESLPLAKRTDDAGTRTELRLLEGVWFHMAYRKAVDVSRARRGLVEVHDWRGLRVFEEIVGKRQLSGDEIRRIGLRAWPELSRSLRGSLDDGEASRRLAGTLEGILTAAREAFRPGEGRRRR